MNEEIKKEYLNIDSSLYQTKLSTKFRERKMYSPPDPRLVISFIPGTVIEILVKSGDKVKKGDDLIVLDAMKMQNKIKCPIEGIVKSFSVAKGTKVSKGTLLAELE